uniref:Uncharacterized protein n=1 Tax=Meloidogyne enterolobii TaxID=390850 RepID=A0A6V7V637_MELEN|nr:unnamed protein product [Meloidogyne enterolobii]
MLGLGQCDQWSPKALKWNEQSLLHKIISLEQSESSVGDRPLAIKTRNCVKVLKFICERFGSKIVEICPEMVNGHLWDMIKENDDGEEFLLLLDYFGVIFPAITDKQIRFSLIKERIGPKIPHIMALLVNTNPAIRFRVARFLSNLTEIELCPMLRLFFQPLSEMISDNASTSVEWAMLGASELLLRLSTIASKLLGAISLISLLALRCIGDRNESVRAAAALAFRQFVALLPLENRQNHFLHELFDDSKLDDKSEMTMLQNTYINSFSLVDVLGCPGNLPKLRRDEIPFLVDTLDLRDYQIEGITWLTFLNRFGLNGILADDMGLGKTLQVLSLLSWDYVQRVNQNRKVQHKEGHLKSSLIVCPRTLVDHWCKEWSSFFPSSQISIQKVANYRESNEGRERILVVSYEELRSNKELREYYWHYLVLDEGHCIRNPASQLFESVCAVKCSHRLILSGTPVQNSPADLWALFTFLMPGYLSSRAAFQSKYMRHILACRNARASEQQIKEGEQALQSLHKQCLPFVLRRLKSEVLAELPEKIVQDRECELTVLQRNLYQLIVDCCSLNARDVDTESIQWLTPIQVLHALRKLVDHPLLISKLIKSLRCEDTNYNYLAEQCMQSHIEQSGKMLALRELLNECQIGERFSEYDVNYSRNKGLEHEQKLEQVSCTTANYESQNFLSNTTHKALIFCQWRATIELISYFLNHGEFGSGINFLVLDGQTPPSQRQSIVDRFNTDPNVQLLLLTTHVGGIGLNLTGADVVIFMDHDWNPFRDLQAIDRAHRLGQKRTVNVFRLITLGTVEEKVMRLQKFKTDTANALIGVENRSLASMATDDLLELFSLKNPGTNLDVNAKLSNTKKKSRMNSNASCSSENGVWAVDELWGNQKEEEDTEFEQYIEQHSVKKFLYSNT